MFIYNANEHSAMISNFSLQISYRITCLYFYKVSLKQNQLNHISVYIHVGTISDVKNEGGETG